MVKKKIKRQWDRCGDCQSFEEFYKNSVGGECTNKDCKFFKHSILRNRRACILFVPPSQKLLGEASK